MEKKIQTINSIWWHTWTLKGTDAKRLNGTKIKKHDNLKCDSGRAWRVTYACTHRDLPLAQGNALPIARGHPLPQITTKGIPHHHKPPSPREPWVQVGLLTGRDVWAFAHLYHLPMGAEQGYAQKKATFVGASRKLKMGILKTTGTARFTLHGCDISIDKIHRK